MPMLRAPETGVVVRMYRQGLGDCFLLAFPTETPGRSYYVLIDCGVILGTPDAATRMTSVAQDIAASTGGEIHLLIVTHQHWDHVSGFLQAQAVFERMRIHNLWFAWTEDPDDPLANHLRAQRRANQEALRAALNLSNTPGALQHVESLLQFFGDTAVSGDTEGGSTTDAAWREIKRLAERSPAVIRYLRPGELLPALPPVRNFPASNNAKLYVLGPPHDERLLKQSDPSASGNEVYSEAETIVAHVSLRAADADPVSDTVTLDDSTLPFDPRVSMPLRQARAHPFFKRYYGFTDPAANTRPNDEYEWELGDPWRRIDEEWLSAAAGRLALKLDNDTNNTSLVLAIELERSRKVLLFVGDAQVGSWLSWSDLKWGPEDASQNQVTADDLLRRAVLYKVGHHGSHNATIRSDKKGLLKKGLELMDRPDLVAMLPVDQEAAATLKHWKRMPFDPLIKRLKERTLGRLMRIDDPFPKSRPSESSEKTWQTFGQNFWETSLYMQFTVIDEVV